MYDLADCAYDAEEIKAVSKKMGHIPVIDSNPRRGETLELPPDRKIRYRERSAVERVNSDLKDNYGARHVRVKGHWKVLCHLMFGIIAEKRRMENVRTGCRPVPEGKSKTVSLGTREKE